MHTSLLNPSIYCCMSELAYKDNEVSIDTSDSSATYKFLKKRGWKILAIPEDLKDSQFGYFSMVFQNEENKLMVVAHRGTVWSLGAVKANNELLLGEFPRQMQPAQHLMNFLHKNYSEYEITHTGHSLGGALAALSAHQFCESATIFEPFGVQEILKKYLSNQEQHSFDSLPVTTFLSGMNLVNVSASHIGLKLHFCPGRSDALLRISDVASDWLIDRYIYADKGFAEKYPFVPKENIISLLLQHRIIPIREAFVDNDQNGIPTQLLLVNSWPSNPANYFRLINEFGITASHALYNQNNVPDPNKRKRIEDYGYQISRTQEYDRINLSYFDQGIRSVIEKVCNDKNEDGVPAQVCSVLRRCKIENQALVVPEGMTMLHLKLYLERTKDLKKFRHCPAPITKEFDNDEKLPIKETPFWKKPEIVLPILAIGGGLTYYYYFSSKKKPGSDISKGPSGKNSQAPNKQGNQAADNDLAQQSIGVSIKW